MSLTPLDLSTLSVNLHRLGESSITDFDAMLAASQIAHKLAHADIETPEDEDRLCSVLWKAEKFGLVETWIAHTYQPSHRGAGYAAVMDETRQSMVRTLSRLDCFGDTVYRHLDQPYAKAMPHESDREVAKLAKLAMLPSGGEEPVDVSHAVRSNENFALISNYESRHPGLFSDNLQRVLKRSPAEVLKFFDELPVNDSGVEVGGFHARFGLEINRHADSALDEKWTPADLAALNVRLYKSRASYYNNTIIETMLKRSPDDQVGYAEALAREINAAGDAHAVLADWLGVLKERFADVTDSRWPLARIFSGRSHADIYPGSVRASLFLARKDFVDMSSLVNSNTPAPIYGRKSATVVRQELADSWEEIHPEDLAVFQDIDGRVNRE